jgi:hypothetical protein
MLERFWLGSTEIFQENPVLASHCTPKIPHRLTCDWNRIFAVRRQELTAWNMAQNIHRLISDYSLINQSFCLQWYATWDRDSIVKQIPKLKHKFSKYFSDPCQADQFWRRGVSEVLDTVLPEQVECSSECTELAVGDCGQQALGLDGG